MTGAGGTGSGGRWGTTTTLEELARWLSGCSRVVVLTHSKPDGDAAGATLALARALRHAAARRGGSGDPATVWYDGPTPVWLNELAGDTPVRVTEADDTPHPGEADAIVIVDTGSWSQLDRFRAWLHPRREKAAVIDHHLQGDADVAPRRVVDTGAAAVCEPVAELCRLLLGLGSAAELPRDVAEPLYLGLATDTGWFKFSNVSASAHRLAADLLDAGADHSWLYTSTEQQDRAARICLMARALSSLELHHGGRAALMTLTRKDFDECGAGPGDSSGFAEIPASIASVRVVAMLTEAEPSRGSGPMTKVSMRSKGDPDGVDVNDVTRKLGGGGHARAAGVRLNCSLSEAKRKILEALA